MSEFPCNYCGEDTAANHDCIDVLRAETERLRIELNNTENARKAERDENQRVRSQLMASTPICESEDPAEYVEKMQYELRHSARLREIDNSEIRQLRARAEAAEAGAERLSAQLSEARGMLTRMNGQMGLREWHYIDSDIANWFTQFIHPADNVAREEGKEGHSSSPAIESPG